MRRKPRLFGFALVLAMMALSATHAACASGASDLKSDETVVLFPAYGLRTDDGKWLLNVRAWVFEPERDSTLRKNLIDSIARHTGVPDAGEERERFEERLAWFLVDNERGKILHVRIGDQLFPLSPTKPNGHSVNRLQLTACPVRRQASDECAGRMELRLEAEDRPSTTGSLRLIPDEGVSVVSDIDDTIKISHITDTGQMLRTAFLEAYRPVPGMSELYRRWKEQGAEFHYLSNSPWHLYPLLSEFATDSLFPPGTYHLMEYRLKDETVLDLFNTAHEKKYHRLERLVTDFPQRRFILVGDSGEEDPEIYGDLARAFPAQIQAIFIRAVEGSDLSEQRWKMAFLDLEKERWLLFRSPGELPVELKASF